MKVHAIAATVLLGIGLCAIAPARAADGCVPVEAEVRTGLGALLPSGVVIDTIRIDGARAYVDGNAPSNALVSQFLRALTTASGYEQPELIEVAYVNSRIAYKLMVKVRCTD